MSFFFLLFYFVCIFIRPQDFFSPLMGVPLAMLSLVAASMAMFTEKKRSFDSPQVIALFLLVPAIFMSGVLNGGPGVAIQSVQSYLTSILLPFLVVSNIINTTNRQKQLIIFLIGVAMLMVNHGISQKAAEDGIGWGGVGLSQGTRITYLGIFNDPNDLGMFLTMAIPLAILMFSLTKGMVRYVYLFAVGYIAYGVYLTNSRGALLGGMGLFAFWFYLRYGLAKSMLSAMFILPAALVLMSKFRKIDSEEESAAGRLDAWYEGFQMLFSHPIHGVGMGQFTEHHHLTAHNSLVLVFAELGLVGYFLWLVFMVYGAVQMLSLWHPAFSITRNSAVERSEVLIAKAFTFSLVAFLITSFFLSRSYVPTLYVFAAMFLATHLRNIDPPKGAKRAVTEVKAMKYVWGFFWGSLILLYLSLKVFL